MLHSRSACKKYQKLQHSSNECDFCTPTEKVAVIIEEREHALVIENRIAYTYWERRCVKRHLLIVPKLHVGQLVELPPAARHDVMDLIAKYEQLDYDVYARSPQNPTRSVPHHHIHLIKSEKKMHNFIFFVARPYLLIHR